MKAAKLRLRPGIRTVLDLPAILRVGTVDLLVTAVANVSGRAVAHNVPLVVRRVTLEMISGRAFPAVELLVVIESGHAHFFGAAVGMPREPLQDGRNRRKKQHVPAHHQCFGMEAVDDHFTSADSTTSVKRLSAGCSGAARGRGCRTPSQAR